MMIRRIGIQEIGILGLFLAALMLAVDPVYASVGASAGGGSGLPIEGHIARLVQTFTGPVANGVVIFMFLGAAVSWYRAGDFGTISIGFLTAGIIGSVIVAVAKLVEMLYSGAVIDEESSLVVLPYLLVVAAWSYAFWIVRTKAIFINQGVGRE